MALGVRPSFDSTLSRVAQIGIAFGTALGCAWSSLQRCVARTRQRRALAELEDRMLRDIGVTRRAAADEASKPFWRS